MDGKTLNKLSSTFGTFLTACWIHLRCLSTFVAMKTLFLDQAMNWWFVDSYPRCDLPVGILGTRLTFLRTNKLLKNRCVFFCCCSNGSAASFTRLCRPSLLDYFLIKLWTSMWEQSKLGCSFQVLYAFQPFSLKSFSRTAFCLSFKTILLRSSELGNWEMSQRRPVTLHCNGFLYCHDFFTRQRRKKTN